MAETKPRFRVVWEQRTFWTLGIPGGGFGCWTASSESLGAVDNWSCWLSCAGVDPERLGKASEFQWCQIELADNSLTIQRDVLVTACMSRRGTSVEIKGKKGYLFSLREMYTCSANNSVPGYSATNLHLAPSTRPSSTPLHLAQLIELISYGPVSSTVWCTLPTAHLCDDTLATTSSP